jgi:hypothetical protein
VLCDLRAFLGRALVWTHRAQGKHLAASTGASTRELMARMGHASPRAALIYQNATLERDHALDAALSLPRDGCVGVMG